jgi:hypothetical protein
VFQRESDTYQQAEQKECGSHPRIAYVEQRLHHHCFVGVACMNRSERHTARPAAREIPGHDSLPVMVPRSDKRLAPVSPERIRRLRQHLLDIILDLRRAGAMKPMPSAVAPEPDDFAGVIARAACKLCKGFCCRNGDDNGFIDDKTLARVRLANPRLSDEAIVMLYLDRIPSTAYRDSCIFHGKKGCTLDRSLRADVCNTYFCGGLRAYIKSDAVPEPTVVIAGDSEKMRVSPVLVPSPRQDLHQLPRCASSHSDR